MRYGHAAAEKRMHLQRVVGHEVQATRSHQGGSNSRGRARFGRADGYSGSMRPSGGWASSPGVARAMRANKKRDTSPELAVRRIVHAAGLRYRVAAPPIPGFRRTADLLFRPARVAVFIDGCFWHSCPVHATSPRAHSDYWLPKLERNRERDAETTAVLQEAGWTVLRFWEHEDPTEVAATIVAIVTERRAAPPSDQPPKLGIDASTAQS